MAKTNTAPRNTNRTAHGAPALPTAKPAHELRRAVASCLLWEDNFYESGVAIAERIHQLAAKVKPEIVAALALEARTTMNLRHAPLWLLTALLADDVARPKGFAATLAKVLRRADEPGELISLYRKAYPQAKHGLPAALKRGVALAFQRYDAYQLGKYNRKAEFSLKDVLRLTHPKPSSDEQAALWKQVVDGTLASPDTWEVALSAGADKKATFERLLGEGKLGYLALIRNLRNMEQAGVSRQLVSAAIRARKGAHVVLPFRYVAAAKAAPSYEADLDHALLASLAEVPQFAGETIVLVDVSPSMNAPLSAKSDMTRMVAAATLAAIFPGRKRVFTFDDSVREVPARSGMGGVDAILRVKGRSTLLGAAVAHVNQHPHDRLVVITDEESFDPVPPPEAANAYMINVTGGKNEVGYGSWTRIAGFSENVLAFMREHEQLSSLRENQAAGTEELAPQAELAD